MKTSAPMWSTSKASVFGLSLFLLLAVLPLLLGLGYALLYSFGVTGVLSEGFTLAYWSEVLSDGEIAGAFLFSFYIATVTMLISVILAGAIAIFLKSALQQGALSTMIYLPLALPAMVAGFFIFQLLSGGGWLSSMTFQLGLTDSIQEFPGLINDPYGTGIIAAHVMMAVPFLSIYFHNIYRSEGIEQLEQAARTLGASRFNRIRRVVVPVLFSRALPTLLLYYIFVLGSYEIPLLLGRESSQMVSVLAIRKLRRFNLEDIPEAYIIAIIYIVLVLSVLLMLFRKRRLAYDR